MPRVVPSQVVAFVDQLFPWVDTHPDTYLHRSSAGQLSGLLELVDQLPSELLTLDGPTYCNYVCSIAAIRNQIEYWNTHGESSFKHVQGLPQVNPVTLIRRTLARCPDEGPVPSTSELVFIADIALRDTLRADLGAIYRALSNGEWKAATVLAGSVVEALLLWALGKKNPSEITAAGVAAVGKKMLKSTPPANVEHWGLQQYIEISAELSIIKPDTAAQARLTQDFRNLIHPGRVQRTGQECDRGTAYSAVACVDHVIRDLNP